MNDIALPPDARLYLQQMIEVKQRFRAIDRVQGAKKPRTLNEDTDNEFMWLQIRKILELVTYSAIASDLERYTAFRIELKGKVEHDQKANRMLPWLAGVNPRFMPYPTGKVLVGADGVKSIGNEVDDSQKATLDRLTDIFNEASDHLHIANPFQVDAKKRDLARRSNSLERIREVHWFLTRLLWCHYKFGLAYEAGDDPKSVAQPERIFIIDMGNLKSDSDLVTMKTAMPL